MRPRLQKEPTCPSCHSDCSEESTAAIVTPGSNAWIVRGALDDNLRRPLMQSCRRSSSGFSLVEVIIAVGIFAAAVTVILALLPALTRQAAGSADTLTALRLPDALHTELQRVATAGGFDALAGQTKPLAAPLPDTLTLVASRDATRVQACNYLPPPAADQIGEDERYFLIEAWRFTQAPLAFDPSGAVLALHIRVSWPYRLPGSSTATPLAGREQITCNLVINR